ncbi:thiolase family protein [Paenarthrobacter sp. Z7-10]|uniref:thiolase family protein n=1 Tax=Paenarthrobacter sp. Z7-10 TaxID=2787635 RepID=UPI0022A94119|nr:thiolase family protein [Paenarthrobacter sp. Z7-10]
MSAASADREPVIIAARRTAIGRAGGAFRGVPAHDLLAPVLRQVLLDTGLQDGQVSDVIMGNAVGGGGNVARLASLTAGLPVGVPGLTVDRQCGSGLEAIVLAARLVAAGAGDAYLAGGVESISTAPARAHRLPDGSLDFYDRAQFAPLWLGDTDVGTAAENVAVRYGISRDRQDQFALRSHRLAVAARSGQAFRTELVELPQLAADQGPRPSLTPELLARFPAAFVPGGTVTAGNSCPYSDGACAVVVTSRAKARQLGAQEALAFVDSAVSGNEPAYLGVGAESSTRELLRRTGERLEDIGLIEFNEAFAAQVLAVLDLLGIDPGRINAQGGALALGHPYGASGAVLVTRLFAQARSGSLPGQTALGMVSIAGGMGISTLFRWEQI